MLLQPVNNLRRSYCRTEVVLDVWGLHLHHIVVVVEDKEEDPADWQHCWQLPQLQPTETLL